MKQFAAAIVCAGLALAGPAFAEMQGGDVAPGRPEADRFLEGATEVLTGVEDVSMAAMEMLPGLGEGELRVLTVGQCVEIAVRRNGHVLTAEAEADAARERVGQAGSARLPQVSAVVAWTQVENQPFSGGAASLLGDFAGDRRTRTDRLSIEQVIYAGGRITSAIQASRYLAQSADWRKEAAVDELTFETRRAFHDCLLADALVDVAQDSVVTFSRHVDDAQTMFDAGMVSNFEVLRARTELGAREADLVAARNGRRLALSNLKRILALPQETRLVLEGQLNWRPLEENLPALVEQARRRRPELLALEAGFSAAEREIRRQRGQYLPQVGASAEWTNVDGGGGAMPEGWVFNLAVQLDIYAGNRRFHDVAEARANHRGLKHQLDDVKRLIELDVHRSYIQVQDAIALIKSEKGTVELAKEGLRLAELRFREGVGIQTDILDAQLALSSAQTSLARALREYAVAHSALEKAVGAQLPEAGALVAADPQ